MAEQNQLTSKELLNQLTTKHYNAAFEAKAEGKPVVWATSICPDELLDAMDLTTLYPENHAAAIGARKEAMTFIEQAESVGYSEDICSYARVNMGFVDLQHSEAQNMPLPNLIFSCSNICSTVLKWYENIAKKLHIPMILFDMPFNHQYEVTDQSVRYIRGQIENAISQLEDFTGRKMDYDKLSEKMEMNNATCEWWKKATDLAQLTPSPLSGFDMFNYMAMIVCMRSSEDGHRLFKLWYEELKQKAEEGKGPWKDAEERYRIVWDGIACWPHLYTTFKLLKKYGINLVASTYPKCWYKVYETNDLNGMARAYSEHYANRNLDFGADQMVGLIQDFHVDGAIFHSNRSCKLMDLRTFEIQRRIQERVGCPSVVFDGDQTDPRVFSDGQYETRIQALVEMMEQNKEMEKRGNIV